MPVIQPDILATLNEIDDEQCLSNYEEDNFEAGWHAAIHEVKRRLGLRDPEVTQP